MYIFLKQILCDKFVVNFMGPEIFIINLSSVRAPLEDSGHDQNMFSFFFFLSFSSHAQPCHFKCRVSRELD